MISDDELLELLAQEDVPTPPLRPVEEVIRRGRSLRRRRRARRAGITTALTATVAAVAAVAVLASAPQTPGGGGHLAQAPTPVASPDVAAVAVSVPLSASPIGICSGTSTRAPASASDGMRFVPARPPAGMSLTAAYTNNETSCALPPAQLLLLDWADTAHTALSRALTVWGPGAKLAAGPGRSAVTVRNGAGQYAETSGVSQLGWTEPDGNGWVISGSGATEQDMIAVADHLILRAAGSATLPDAATLGFTSAPTGIDNTTSSTPDGTVWYAEYDGPDGQLTITARANGTLAGPILATVEPAALLRFSEVRGQIAVGGQATTGHQFITWQERPGVVVTLFSTLTQAQLRDTAATLIQAPRAPCLPAVACP